MKSIKFKNGRADVPIGKIVCVGRNYAAHVKEMGHSVEEFPVIFLKTASNVIYSGEPVIHPDYSNNLHHEVELVLFIGETIKNADLISSERAIYGYAVGLDMTLRDLQNDFIKKGNPWTISKSFDTAAVLSEIVIKDQYLLRGDETISLSVNGVTRQNTSIKDMIFSPVEIVKYISSKMTLEMGDLIFTGTPEGVGQVIRGDKIEASLENVGRISTNVI
jgi:5-carboxymethyl-2-hydroxymuconate isomerase